MLVYERVDLWFSCIVNIPVPWIRKGVIWLHGPQLPVSDHLIPQGLRHVSFVMGI